MANFNTFKNSIDQAEGGYQDDPTDWRGNNNSLGILVGTNRGISAPTYEKWIGRPPSVADMKAITLEEAHNIFKLNFWDKMMGDNINNQAVAEIFIDHYINAPRDTVRYMQEAINSLGIDSLVEDNSMGILTLNALNNQNSLELFLKFKEKRLAHYEKWQNWDINVYNKYIFGWRKRVNDLHIKHIDYLNQFVNTVKSNPKKSIAGFGLAAFISYLIYKKKR